MSNKQFVIVVIITFIVIVIWIVADIWHTKPSVEVNPKLTTLLEPISPTFDQKVISQIQEVTPVGEIEPDISAPRPVATISAQPVGTPSQTPLPLPSAIVASLSATLGGNQ